MMLSLLPLRVILVNPITTQLSSFISFLDVRQNHKNVEVQYIVNQINYLYLV